MDTTRSTAALASILLAIAVAVPARAEDKAAARQAYTEGSKHYDLSQYSEALEAFKRAYWNYEDPAILFNIAQCHRALGHKAEAVAFYKSYLRKSPTALNREEVQKIIADLEAAISSQRSRDAVDEAPGTAPNPTVVVKASRAAAPSAGAGRKTVKPWVWVLVGGTVAVAAGLGFGLGFGLSHDRDPTASFGTTVLR